MAQAKTFTQSELDQVPRYISTKKYALRDRAMILTSFWSGMRVGEIANLRMRDVLNDDGSLKNEVRLSAAQTKGDKGRLVFIPQKLKDEWANYLTNRKVQHLDVPLFHTENRLGFSLNGLSI